MLFVPAFCEEHNTADGHSRARWSAAVYSVSLRGQRESVCAATYAAQRSLQLLPEHLFNLADFLLDFAGEFLVLAFGHQVGIIRDLSRFLFSFPLHFMNAAFDLIRRAQFHLFLLVVLCLHPVVPSTAVWPGHRAGRSFDI